MKRILILSNHHSYTYNLRKEIIAELINLGYKIYVVVPYGEKVELLKDMGCQHIDLPLDRRGINPITDFKLLTSYYKLIKKLKPDVVISYTIKPNIYGGIACRILRTPIIANITGLGTAVNNEGILKKALIQLYKTAFKKVSCVFFQNNANKDFFLERNIPLKGYRVIPGSGINTNEFKYKGYPNEDEDLKFLYIGRIMKDKGIEEFITAAERIKEKHKNIQFHALGSYEDDYRDKIEELEDRNIIKFHGVKNNVEDYLESCHAIIHPTYHEGMSNVLLEAAATGRPVLASNIPGCKEIFDEGVSGIGFQPKDVNSLVEAVEKFIELSNEEKRQMGIEGRRKVEKEFDRQIVVDAYIEEINKITNGK